MLNPAGVREQITTDLHDSKNHGTSAELDHVALNVSGDHALYRTRQSRLGASMRLQMFYCMRSINAYALQCPLQFTTLGRDDIMCPYQGSIYH